MKNFFCDRKSRYDVVTKAHALFVEAVHRLYLHLYLPYDVVVTICTCIHGELGVNEGVFITPTSENYTVLHFNTLALVVSD